MSFFEERPVLMTKRLVDSLRNAAVAWYHCEAGAPAIHPATPITVYAGYETSPQDSLMAFVQCGVMDPGVYRYANPLLGLGPFTRHDHGIPSNYFEGKSERLRDEIEIDITANHLKLLKCFSFDDCAPPERPGFDPKRPYQAPGKQTSSIADLLFAGEDEDLADEEDFDITEEMHHEMASVLQVFLREAKIEPGVYSGIPVFNNWRCIKPCGDLVMMHIAKSAKAREEAEKMENA
jgi:hypothetical protein